MTIGFRMFRRARKVDAAAVGKFRALPLANVSDVMSRMSAGGARLRPMHGGGALAGPALTVKTRPGDNLMVHKALDLAEPRAPRSTIRVGPGMPPRGSAPRWRGPAPMPAPRPRSGRRTSSRMRCSTVQT
jgi:hypothetical protein